MSKSFKDSHLGRLRAVVGTRLLLLPTACVVVQREDGRVLLQHRSDFEVWGLPGGFAEEGERLQDGIIRETLEEMGIAIRNVRPFAFSDDPEVETRTYPGGDRCHTFTLVFFTREFDGEPRVNDEESLGVGWFALDDLPPLMPNMARMLDGFRAFLRTGEFQIV
jgi:ADP-ribose pyrophosphatase YjhB (NUDIX family)